MLIEWLRRRDDEARRAPADVPVPGRARSSSSSTRPSTAATPAAGRRSRHRLAPGGGVVNHLHRDLAPISADAWAAIETEVRRALTTFLTARRLVDFSGPARLRDVVARPRPHGARPRGAGGVGERRGPRVAAARGAAPSVRDRVGGARRRRPGRHRRSTSHRPSRRPGASRWSRTGSCSTAWTRPRSTASPPSRCTSRSRPAGAASAVPPAVARALTVLQRAGVEGPYALALGTPCYTRVVEGTEDGYPVLKHLRLVLDGGLADPRAGARRRRRGEPARRRLRARRRRGPLARLRGSQRDRRHASSSRRRCCSASTVRRPRSCSTSTASRRTRSDGPPVPARFGAGATAGIPRAWISSSGSSPSCS